MFSLAVCLLFIVWRSLFYCLLCNVCVVSICYLLCVVCNCVLCVLCVKRWVSRVVYYLSFVLACV